MIYYMNEEIDSIFVYFITLKLQYLMEQIDLFISLFHYSLASVLNSPTATSRRQKQEVLTALLAEKELGNGCARGMQLHAAGQNRGW